MNINATMNLQPQTQTQPVQQSGDQSQQPQESGFASQLKQKQQALSQASKLPGKAIIGQNTQGAEMLAAWLAMLQAAPVQMATQQQATAADPMTMLAAVAQPVEENPLAQVAQQASAVLPQQPVQNKAENSQQPVQAQQTTVPVAQQLESQNASQAGDQQLLGSQQPETRKEEIVELSAADTAPQPLFEKVEHMPIRVAQTLDTTSPQMPQQLAAKIEEAVQQGGQVQIRLTPEHLGELVVEVTRSEEGLQVVLHTTNQKATNLLSAHSQELGALLGKESNQPVQVQVRQPDSGQQASQQHNYDGRNGQHQQQQQQPKHQQDYSEDFIQQLRLGLMPLEAASTQ